MNIIALDAETYWAKDFTLSKMTTQEYILDYRFDCILVGWQVNDGPKEWVTGTIDQIKRELQELDWENSALLCQNTMFDGAILAWHMGIKPMAYLDTLAMSRALYPHEKSHSLAAQAKREGLQDKGTEVLNAQGKYRHDFTDGEMNKYAEYCLNDCDLTYKLAMRYLPRMKKSELKLIDSTLRMYIEPQFVVDRDVLEAHLERVIADKQALLTDVLKLCGKKEATTDDLKFVLASNAKFAEALALMGVEPPMKISATTGKETFAFAKTDEAFKALEDHEDPRVQALVAARLGTKSTIEETRTQRLIKCADLAVEVPIALRYYGAWTGRWSADASGATNFQNMPRKSPMKKAIKAPEGYMICGADLSNIELRLGLWLAGQWDKVELVRQGRDLYKDLASKVNSIPYEDVPDDMRQTFKVVNLSAIYQTGGARMKETLRIMAKQKIPLEDAKRLVYAYRDENDKVVEAWEECHNAMLAITSGQEVPALFRGLVPWDYDVQGFLLPSGLHLQMPGLRIEYNDKGKPQFVFDGAYGPEKTYGGKLFQGLTQALARCVIGTGWLRIEKRHRIGLSVHDSLYWIVKEHLAQESFAWGVEQMTKPISWCPDLPLAAEGGFGKTLGDIK